MSITKRDRYLVNLLDNQLKCISTKQVGMLPAFDCSNVATSRRLKKICEYGLVQRQLVEIVGNMYVYWSASDKYLTKEIEHSLAMTDIYIALVRAGYEIISFEIEKGLKFNANNKDKIIIPDIMIVAKKNEKIRQWFVEICLDRKIKEVIKKYNVYKGCYIPYQKKLGKQMRARELLVVSDIMFSLEDGVTISRDVEDMERFFREYGIEEGVVEGV